jgi:DNA-binding NarL/FixJ family response regulator
MVLNMQTGVGIRAGETRRTVSVLVVDEHSIVRQSLCATLDECPELQVIGTAATGAQALEIAARTSPGVVVMDYALHDLSGVDVAAEILCEQPHIRIVMLSMCQAPESVVRALRAGAHAYVLKQSASTELAPAVMATLRGERYLSSPIAHVLRGPVVGSASRSPIEYLSAREREVLQFTVSGATSAQIARKLALSPKTVETYRSRIREKLGVADHAGLIRFALQHTMYSY